MLANFDTERERERDKRETRGLAKEQEELRHIWV